MSPTDTQMESNNLIYTFSDSKHHIFLIVAITAKEITCKKVDFYPLLTPILPNIDWRTVGVYKKGPVSCDGTSIRLDKKEIAGKIILVKDLYITCPSNVLNEK